MAGPPGTGKSHVAQRIGRELGLPVLSVEAIVAAMWRAGVGGPGEDLATGLAVHLVVEAAADGLLGLGQGVVVDAVNDGEPAHAQWRGLARRHGVELRFFGMVCSDRVLHRARLDGRAPHVGNRGRRRTHPREGLRLCRGQLAQVLTADVHSAVPGPHLGLALDGCVGECVDG